MGTTQRQPDHPAAASVPTTGSPAHGSPKADAWELPPDQLVRYDEARDWIRRRLREVEQMSPAERAEADAEWALFRNSMNEDRARAGARPLFVDER